MLTNTSRFSLLALLLVAFVGLVALLSLPAQAAPAFDCSTVTEIPQVECEALVALYNATGGDNWTNNTGWLQTSTPCTWFGVFCSSGFVNRISLPDNNLSGSVPAEIGNLANIQYLYLNNNQLSSLPPEIGNLSNLIAAYLFENQLTGLPPEFGNLSNLATLYLDRNQLASLPAEIGNLSKLRALSLYNNQLSSLPPEFGNLTNLDWLELHDNRLSSLPPEFGNLSALQSLKLRDNRLISLPSAFGNLSALTTLFLDNNQLSSLPPEIGNLTNLDWLELQDNQLSSLPAEIGNLSNLTRMHLYNNQLTSLPPETGNLYNLHYLPLSNNQLSNLPPELGNLSTLWELHLSDNQLSSLPPEFGGLITLRVLDLDNNQLSSLPPEFGALASLKYLYLDGNRLSSLPAEIGNLSALAGLSLVRNQLSSLPSEFGNLSGVVSVNLSGNQLSSLPPEIGNLSNLKGLILKDNQLSSLPPEIGSLSGLVSVNLSGNQLSSLPSEIGNLSNLTWLELDNNPLSGSLPAFLANLTQISRFTFYATEWCVPADDLDIQAWLAGISTLFGTGYVCGQEPGALSGIVTAGDAPLPGVFVTLYRDIFQTEVVDTTTTDASGAYTFTNLGQDIDYKVYFAAPYGTYAPEYYDNQPTITTATPVNITLGMTRTNINAILDAPQPAQATITTTGGTVQTNPDGTVFVNVVNGQQADITVTRVVTCAEQVTPDPVLLEMAVVGGAVLTYPMNAAGNDQYHAAIPAADITGDATLTVRATCNGTETETPIGFVNLYDPIGNITDEQSGSPIPGATVSLYHVPGWLPRNGPDDTRPNTCESNLSKAEDAEWSQSAPVDEGVLVNAELTTVSPLINWQYTDDQGHYGWDVPEGCWYLTVEADGYEQLISPVVGMPLAVLDLDLALTPLIWTPQVTIAGPAVGQLGIDYTFTATVRPLTVTQPLTYVWQATGMTPVTHSGGDRDDVITWQWTTDGEKTITVSASNGEVSLLDTHTLLIEIGEQSEHRIYLPLVRR